MRPASNHARFDLQQGFTLVEVMLGVSVLLTCTLALGLSLQAGAFAARQLREEQILLARAQTLVDRMVAQEFGHTYDSDPVAAQLEEILDNDAVPGDITLHQLSRWPEVDGGWKFVDAVWNAKLEPYEDGYFDPYYDGFLYLFSLMHLSGNYRIIK